MATKREALKAEKDRRENVCAAIVCDALGNGARWHRRDVPGAPSGTHDFDIEFSDGHFEALEISAFTDEEAEKQRVALEGNDVRDSRMLGRVWLLSIPDRGLDLGEIYSGRLHSRVEAELAVLESNHHDRLDVGDYWKLAPLGASHPVVHAMKALFDMGIRDASSLLPQPGMTPFFELRVSTGFAVDPNSVNTAVEDRADSNADKLRRATGVTARHIFVPVYFGSPMTFIAAIHVPGSTPPSLPTGISRAWVLGAPETVLYAEPPKVWQSTPFDPDATAHPDRWRAP